MFLWTQRRSSLTQGVMKVIPGRSTQSNISTAVRKGNARLVFDRA